MQIELTKDEYLRCRFRTSEQSLCFGARSAPLLEALTAIVNGTPAPRNLLVCAPSGSGKSLLLRQVLAELRACCPQRRTLLLPMPELIEGLLCHIREGTQDEGIRSYASTELLVLDDSWSVAGKEHTLLLLKALLAAMPAHAHAVLLFDGTSDVAQQSFGALFPLLQPFVLEEPNLAGKQAFARELAAREHLQLAPGETERMAARLRCTQLRSAMLRRSVDAVTPLEDILASFS